MYAVVETDGKQYKVATGKEPKVERISTGVGAEITLDQAFAMGTDDRLRVGASLVSGAAARATIISYGRHDRVHIFKMRHRKHYQKRQGHRQNCAKLHIDSIMA